MKIDLSGKAAVVTGSTAGIGFAIARGLASAGAEVVVNGRTEERVRTAKEALESEVSGARVRTVAADLGTPEGASALAEAAPEADILVNNLGTFDFKAFADFTDEEWQRFFDVNIMSGVRASRHYLPRMVERGWGRIVFVSSESALNIPADMIPYGMTKTAQLSIARGLAESVAGSGVTVNTILPGPTRSEGLRQTFEREAEKAGVSLEQFERDFMANERPTSLIQRLLDPAEVANAVVYLCSEQASGTSGAPLRVEGGLLRSIA